MYRHFILTAFLAGSAQGFAQGYGDTWQFGYDIGLHFHACGVDVVEGSNAGFEGCAAVSGPGGDLLFYTNGEQVWNREHVLMPDGDLPLSNSGSLSQVLIVKQPGPGTLYYVVTTTIQGQQSGQLKYHVVDMALDGGFGDVVSTSNTLFAGMSSEHVAATWHANGTDIWILAHAYPANNFLAYLLTPSGITGPVISAVGPAFPVCGSNMNARGEMKFTIDGSKLVLAGNGVGNDNASNLLVLFDFDPSTGSVSAPFELPYCRGDFGVSFSPDGSKLYAASWKAFNFMSTDENKLYQFDLSSGDPLTIITSRQTIHTTAIGEPFGSLKLGPDGRIYVAGYARTHLGVINEPDLAGSACSYVHDGIYLNGALCAHGLNNYIEYVSCETVVTDIPDPHADPVLVHPNPTRDRLFVNGGHGTAYRVINAQGQLAGSGRITSGSLDVSGLAPGTYVLEVIGTVLRRARFAVE